jgi:hypothetical protein
VLNHLSPNRQHINVLTNQTYKMRDKMNRTKEIVRQESPATASNRLKLKRPKKVQERDKNEVRQVLEPILNGDKSDHSVIFLCWGKESRCRIIPITVTNSADDVTVWQKIRQEWYAYRGHWRKYIPFFNVSEEAIVEVRLEQVHARLRYD